MKSKLKLFLFLVISLVVCTGGALTVGKIWLNTEIAVLEQNRVISVAKGESLYSLSKSLHKKDLLQWPRVWVYYARFIDKTSIKAGEYALSEEESPLSLLDKFISADVIQYKITLVEGTTVNDVLTDLRNEEKLRQTLPLNFFADEPSASGLAVDHLEGWLYPDTYYFVAGDTDRSLLQRAYKRMEKVLSEEWAARAEGLPLTSPYEALILASIVEKETGAPHEREEIAGVFIRRLKLGMRLQTDPTVIYGMGEAYNGNITRADLKKPTPYNTYTIKGLPPTPIAMAGREAIRAALNPADGTSLYFVAKGNGTHYFSDTLEEHIRAVKKYQLQRKENYRSQYKGP